MTKHDGTTGRPAHLLALPRTWSSHLTPERHDRSPYAQPQPVMRIAVAAATTTVCGYCRHTTPQQQAIAHVTTLATGQPVDPSWRMTLHFHPDRLVAGVPILQLLAHDSGIPVPVRDQDQQREPDRTPRRRPLAVAEPHLRRSL